MIYYKIVGEGLSGDHLHIIDAEGNVLPNPAPAAGYCVSRAQLREELHKLAAKLVAEKEEVASDNGCTCCADIWTWHDMVLDDESFVEEYRKEFSK
ncbi:MAG: hypothetical protein NC218_03275 [Acetobacter sp.]|nr:hypothetical protein [Acetobacter sp.]